MTEIRRGGQADHLFLVCYRYHSLRYKFEERSEELCYRVGELGYKY